MGLFQIHKLHNLPWRTYYLSPRRSGQIICSQKKKNLLKMLKAMHTHKLQCMALNIWGTMNFGGIKGTVPKLCLNFWPAVWDHGMFKCHKSGSPPPERLGILEGHQYSQHSCLWAVLWSLGCALKSDDEGFWGYWIPSGAAWTQSLAILRQASVVLCSLSFKLWLNFNWS